MQKQKTSRGFTLIEVLAATGIMTVVILIVLSMTTNVLSVWNKSSGKLGANYEARVALDLLANDFETLVMRNRPFCWIQVDYAQPDHDLSDYSGALPNMPQMYFMARVEDRPRYTSSSSGGEPEPIYGDICAVAYRVLYQDPINPGSGDYPMFGLYRFVIDSEHTFTDVMNVPEGEDADELASLMIGSEFRNEVGDIETVDADTIRQDENFLSANIVDMRVVFYYLDPETGDILPITEGNEEDAPPVNFTYTDTLNIQGSSVPGTLEYVDIAITVMTSEGLSVMESRSAESGVSWHDLVAQYGTTFSRRVPIMAKPL